MSNNNEYNLEHTKTQLVQYFLFQLEWLYRTYISNIIFKYYMWKGHGLKYWMDDNCYCKDLENFQINVLHAPVLFKIFAMNDILCKTKKIEYCHFYAHVLLKKTLDWYRKKTEVWKKLLKNFVFKHFAHGVCKECYDNFNHIVHNRKSFII